MNGCPIHRGPIAMDGNVNFSPGSRIVFDILSEAKNHL
jgi:hypothetical protein